MNGIYLQLLLREIRDELSGAYIEDICMQGRLVQLVLNERSLFISLYPTALCLYVAEQSKKGYEPLRQISDAVKSCRIIDVSQHDFMPVLRIDLERSFPEREEMQIVIAFYPQAPNLGFKAKGRQKNIFPRYLEKEPKKSILELKEEQLVDVEAEQLVKNFEGIDKKMSHELNADNLLLLKKILDGKKFHPRLLSAIPLHVSIFPGEGGEEFLSFNVMFRFALNVFLREQAKKDAAQGRRMAIRNARRRLARLQKRLLSKNEIEEIRIHGEAVLANMSRISKGMTSFKCKNPYSQAEMEVDLDPRLAPQANAQRFFSRYKKEKRGQPQLLEQIRTIKKRIADLEAQSVVPKTLEKKKQREVSAREPFHKFSFSSGSSVFVGKNARSNDELTFKVARPGDYFFHVRGYEGSHVILRPRVPKGQRPSREEIQKAASIAAYFSKARKQNNVPVSYTQRKFLKKNKKGKTGSVILMREEVIFVEPGLHSSEKKSH